MSPEGLAGFDRGTEVRSLHQHTVAFNWRHSFYGKNSERRSCGKSQAAEAQDVIFAAPNPPNPRFNPIILSSPGCVSTSPAYDDPTGQMRVTQVFASGPESKETSSGLYFKSKPNPSSLAFYFFLFFLFIHIFIISSFFALPHFLKNYSVFSQFSAYKRAHFGCLCTGCHVCIIQTRLCLKKAVKRKSLLHLQPPRIYSTTVQNVPAFINRRERVSHT